MFTMTSVLHDQQSLKLHHFHIIILFFMYVKYQSISSLLNYIIYSHVLTLSHYTIHYTQYCKVIIMNVNRLQQLRNYDIYDCLSANTHYSTHFVESQLNFVSRKSNPYYIQVLTIVFIFKMADCEHLNVSMIKINTYQITLYHLLSQIVNLS